jgi:TRAP-type mannitol/chloroaromatic compound transport system permease small subunit
VRALADFATAIDRMNDAVGRWLSWFVIASVALCALTALLRYVLNVGFVWMQELYVALFGLNFMLAAGYAYRLDRHVRIDIYYNRMSRRGRAWVDTAGVLVFLMPWLALVVWATIPFVELSLSVLEPSGQSGGLPGFFVLKSAILVFALLLGAQGLAVLSRGILVLAGRDDLLPVAPAET